MQSYGYSSDKVIGPQGGPMGPMGPMGFTPFQPDPQWQTWNRQPIQNVFQNFTYVADPLSELAGASGCYIKQEADCCECLCKCCSQENQYHVFANIGKDTKYLFKVQERSSCCCRCFCPPNNRTFKLEFKHIASANEFTGNVANLFAKSDKACRCTVCCCCRPEMLTYRDKTNELLSKIVYPCSCCGLTYDVYEGNNNLKYIVDISCCQCGVCCCTGSVKCYNIEIPIYDAKKKGAAIGMILKKKYQDCGEYCTNADTFEIVFPADASPMDKFNIICAGLMIDYMQFEV